MKRILKAYIVIAVVCMMVMVAGCNPLARKFGGIMIINLKPNEKLVTVTWKETSLWVLTRPMKPGETPETYKFKEDSTFGVMEGTVTIIEHK